MTKKILVVLAMGLMLLAGFGFLGRGRTQLAGSTTSPDAGGKIAYASGGAIWMYSGGKAQKLTNGPKDKNDKRDRMPTFSPDGTQIIYSRFDEGYSDLWRMTVANPSGSIAITDLRPKGVEVGQVGSNGNPGWSDLALWANFPSWSPDGKMVAYTTDVGTEYPGLFLIDPEGNDSRKIEHLDHSTQTVERPTWSPDSTRLAVANYVTNGYIGQIWSLNLETGRWLEMTNSKDGAYDPAWSPDGRWVAFTMRQGTANNIFVISTDTASWPGDYPTPIQITTDGASRSPAWSPDGSRLAYLSLRGTSFDLYEGDIKDDANGNPSLNSVQRLTENASIDVDSCISWGK